MQGLCCEDKLSAAKLDQAIHAARRAVGRVVRLRAGGRASFEELEKMTLEVTRELGREHLEAELQTVADRQPRVFRYNGFRYRQHQPGEVAYHSLCGPLQIKRWSYRRVNVRNGPTLIPLEITAGIMERATPALAYCVATGYAKTTMRDLHEDLTLAHRHPPSRTSLERIATRLARGIFDSVDEIEPVIRALEMLPEDACAISVGLDRTTVPMAELRPDGQAANSHRKRRRIEYKRKPPPPIDVNFRMAYVGTVCITDKNGETLQTYVYAAAAHEGPQDLVARVMADVRSALSQEPDLHVGVVQDGGPELWGLIWEAMANEPLVTKYHQAIDRYHLSERLAVGLEAIEPDPARRRQRLRDWSHQLDRKDAAILHIQREFRAIKKRDLTVGQRTKFSFCLDYIEGYETRMRYARLRKLGLPVGSGVTEGACKSLITARTKRSGQRWSQDGISGVLALRTIYRCGRLKEYWPRFTSWKTRSDLAH